MRASHGIHVGMITWTYDIFWQFVENWNSDVENLKNLFLFYGLL